MVREESQSRTPQAESFGEQLVALVFVLPMVVLALVEDVARRALE